VDATRWVDDALSAAGKVIVTGGMAATEVGDDVFHASGDFEITGVMSAQETAPLPFLAKYWTGSTWQVITRPPSSY
jgi:hypothetical protein